VDVDSNRPNLKIVSIVDHYQLALARDPIHAPVADFVEIVTLELPILKRVETKICCNTSTDKQITYQLQGHYIVTLTSNFFTKLPLMSH